MKRLVLILTGILLVLSLFAYARTASKEGSTMDENSVIRETVVEFLSKSAKAVYFYDKQEVAQFTILALPQSDKNAVCESVAANETLLLNAVNTGLEDGKTPDAYALERNVQFYLDGLAYMSHVYETQNITYSRFTEDCDFGEIRTASDLASVSVTQSLEYQYSHADSPTSETIEYHMLLAKRGNNWYVAAIDADSDFYLGNSIDSFDLEQAIFGYDLARSNTG